MISLDRNPLSPFLTWAAKKIERYGLLTAEVSISCGSKESQKESVSVESIINLPKHYEDYIVRSYSEDTINYELKSIEGLKLVKSSIEDEAKKLVELFTSSNLTNKNQVIESLNQKNSDIEKLNNRITEIEYKIVDKKNDEDLLILIKNCANNSFKASEPISLLYLLNIFVSFATCGILSIP